MDVQVMPTLIDQFRETIEGQVGDWTWIIDPKPDAGLLAILDAISHERAFAKPPTSTHNIAAHVAHLRFTFDLTLKRARGEDPIADWASSFNLPAPSAAAWDTLRDDLRAAYHALLDEFNQYRETPPQDMLPIHLVGLAAMSAHNAYHLAAIKQIARAV